MRRKAYGQAYAVRRTAGARRSTPTLGSKGTTTATAMTLDPIRLRFAARQVTDDHRNPRETFWEAIRSENESGKTIAELEGKLTREFGPALRTVLVRHLAEPLRSVSDDLLLDRFYDFDRFFFRMLDDPKSEARWAVGQAFEALVRLSEQRLQLIQSSPALRAAQDRLAAASRVSFSARIAGYSSLNLDLSVAALSSLVEVFDRDFDSFRVFLEAFIPQAFEHVFWEDEANRVEITVQIPPSYQKAFAEAPAGRREESERPSVAPVISARAPEESASRSASRERAEWVWRLANGSLLVPLLLALAVMYFGISMLNELRGAQSDAMKPILEHQLKLLEEDRRRMSKEPAAAAPPPAAVASTAASGSR
jgi:hypothetical protein